MVGTVHDSPHMESMTHNSKKGPRLPNDKEAYSAPECLGTRKKTPDIENKVNERPTIDSEIAKWVTIVAKEGWELPLLVEALYD